MVTNFLHQAAVQLSCWLRARRLVNSGYFGLWTFLDAAAKGSLLASTVLSFGLLADASLGPYHKEQEDLRFERQRLLEKIRTSCVCVLIPHLEACEDTPKKGTKVRSIRVLDDFFASFLAAIDPGILQAIGLGVKQVLALNLQRPRRN